MKFQITYLILLVHSFVDGTRILRGSSSTDSSIYQQNIDCPALPNDAVNLIVEEQNNDDSSVEIGNVWVTNQNGKTCVNADIDESSMISALHIYYKCTPPTNNNPDNFNHHPNNLSATSWCFDTLECKTTSESTVTTTTHGYIAVHVDINPIVEEEYQQDSVNVPAFIQRRSQEEADCTPFLVADQAAIDAAIEPYSNETELGIRWRRTNGGRWDSFFTVSGLFNATNYRGWCVDTDHPMCTNCQYPFDVCSTYRDDFSALEAGDALSNVTNLPAANWLINKYPVNTQLNGQDPICPVDIPGQPIVTWRNFQAAIWKLIDFGYNSMVDCQNNSCEDAADALVACAMSQGIDYRPTCCNETIGLLLVYDDDVTGDLSKQEILVEVPLVDIPGVCVEEPPIDLAPPTDPDDPCYDVYINTTAVIEAIEPWSNEALMAIRFRSEENTREESMFTVDGLLNISNFAAWCIDIDQYACVNCEWSMDSISTYDEAALLELENDSSVENRPTNLTNFNEANFLINEFEVGTSLENNEYCNFDVPAGTVVTWNMMQASMWLLVDHGFGPFIDCGNGSECGDIALQLVECALTEGSDYLPNCCPDSKVAILILWDDPSTQELTRQELLVEVPVPYLPGVCPEYDNDDDDVSGRFLRYLSETAHAATETTPSTPIQQSTLLSTSYAQNNAAWANFPSAILSKESIHQSGFYCQNKL